MDHVFIDESIHADDGFVVSALLFAPECLEHTVEEALRDVGLTPGEDEFKSSSVMRDRPALRRLRTLLKHATIRNGSRIALLITAEAQRRHLGEELVTALSSVSTQNELSLADTVVFVDEGIRPSQSEDLLCEVRWNQNSKTIYGLQVADLIAALGAFVLKETLHGVTKHVRPYYDEVVAPMGWTLKMQLRRTLFRRHPTYDDAASDVWHDAQLLGVGVFTGKDLPPEVTASVESCFSRVWTGCTR